VILRTRVDPASDDNFVRLVELRTQIKAKRDQARALGDLRAERLDTDQVALKIELNSMGYGISIELDVTDSDELVTVVCFGGSDEPFEQHAPHRIARQLLPSMG
jgi:hypothetical protein